MLWFELETIVQALEARNYELATSDNPAVYAYWPPLSPRNRMVILPLNNGDAMSEDQVRYAIKDEPIDDDQFIEELSQFFVERG